MTGLQWDLTRTDWLAGAAWGSSPAFPAWSAIDLVILHWVGSDGVPTSGDAERVDQLLRNMQNSWLTGKGYNLGYTGAADWMGRRIEIRGDTARNAANAPAALNARSVSILCLVNLDGAMTPAQDAAVTDLVAQVLDHAPRATVIGHRDGPRYVTGATATQCPGDVIYRRLVAGEFTPDPTGDDDMTPEQAAQLDQVHTIMAGAFWPNRFNPPPGPNVTDVQDGELATRIRRLEDKVDALLEKLD